MTTLQNLYDFPDSSCFWQIKIRFVNLDSLRVNKYCQNCCCYIIKPNITTCTNCLNLLTTKWIANFFAEDGTGSILLDLEEIDLIQYLFFKKTVSINKDIFIKLINKYAIKFGQVVYNKKFSPIAYFDFQLMNDIEPSLDFMNDVMYEFVRSLKFSTNFTFFGRIFPLSTNENTNQPTININVNPCKFSNSCINFFSTRTNALIYFKALNNI